MRVGWRQVSAWKIHEACLVLVKRRWGRLTHTHANPHNKHERALVLSGYMTALCT